MARAKKTITAPPAVATPDAPAPAEAPAVPDVRRAVPDAPAAATFTKAQFAELSLARARAGDPSVLIGRLGYALGHLDMPLSCDEIRFIRDALERTAEKSAGVFYLDSETPALNLHQFGWWRIASYFDELVDVGDVDDEGLKKRYSPKDAMKKVTRDLGVRERTVRYALRDFGKKRRRPRRR